MAKTSQQTAAQRNPIIVGRRNCSRCGRWRHAVDFKWRWNRRRSERKDKTHKDKTKTVLRTGRYPTPVVDSVCKVCRKIQNREQYAALPKEERQARGRRANERIKARRAELDLRLKQVADMLRKEHSYIDDEAVDITPFRMWLIGYMRRNDLNIAQFAEATDTDIGIIRRWYHGYFWKNGADEPYPQKTIMLSSVDDIGVAIHDVGLLDRLYPYAGPV